MYTTRTISQSAGVALILGVLLGCRGAEAPAAPTSDAPRFVQSPGHNLKGTIVFSSNRDGDFEIFVMDADGSGVTQLTNNADVDEDPAWSPDGRQIAFVRNREIMVMNADGSGEIQLTSNTLQDDGPFWSPDGQRIAFQHETPTGSGIAVMNADGSGFTLLTDDQDHDPAWSSRDQIAFERDVGPGEESAILVMNADGTGVTQLTSNAVQSGDPAWSPNGHLIAFSSTAVPCCGGEEIYVMRANGTGLIRLTNNAFEDDEPVWSPNGRQIVFARDLGAGDFEIFIVDANGSGETRITNNSPFADNEPDWIR